MARTKQVFRAEERVPTDSSLTCPIPKKLFRDIVKISPCCGILYCKKCVQTHLLERNFICHNYSKKTSSRDRLLVDKPTRIIISDYNYIEKVTGGNIKGRWGRINWRCSKWPAGELTRVSRYLCTNTIKSQFTTPEGKSMLQIHRQLRIQLLQAQAISATLSVAKL